MNFLDIRTVIFSQLITDAACAAVLAFLWLQNRQRFAGTFLWVADFIFQTLGVLLISLRGTVPDWMSMGVSNTLVIAGALLGFWGLERFVGKKSSQVHNYFILVAFIVIQFYFIYGKNNLDARTLNISTALFLVCIQCAWLMLRRAGRVQTRVTQTVGWVFAFFCLVSLIRIFILLVHPLASNDFFQSGLYDALALIAYQILLILLAFSLALMVNRWLWMDVKKQEEKFAKAFRSSPYAILITRLADGLILDVNRGFEELTGYPPKEAIGRTTLDLRLFANPADRKVITDELDAKGEVHGMEFQFRAKSGREWTGMLYGEILVVNDEQLILSSISDITARKQAEEEITSLAKFPSENPSPVLRLAHNGTILYANDASRGLLAEWGCAVGKPAPQLWRDAAAESLEKAASTTVDLQSGGRTYSFVVNPVAEADYVNLYGRDETERRQAEEESRQSAEAFAKIFQESAVALALTNIEDGTVIDVNRKWLELTGFRREEVIGKSAAEHGGWKNLEDREEMRRALEEKGEVNDWEAVCLRQNGEEYVVLLSAKVINLRGKRVLLSSNADITERKRAEEALGDSEEKYRLITENANDWVYLLLPDRNVRYTSPSCERVSGYSPQEFADDSNLLLEIVHPDDRNEVESHFEEIQEEPGEDNREFRIMTKTGETRWIHHSCAPVRTPDGVFAGRRGMNRDITERKQAEEALQKTLADLERSNADLEQFAYVASHDLQEPLRMVSSFTQLLADRYQGKLDKDADEFISFAVDGANRMQGLIDDLLSYARVGTKGKPPAPVPADRTLDRALENLQAAIQENTVEITRNPLPTVMVDDVQLTQVFQNLIANAIKFKGDRPPRISVSCEARGADWVFSVRDNGIGIDPQYFERIFTIFQRLNPRGKYPGTGIGLAMCKKIVLRHGGRIWAESKPGEGSTFFFTLPMLKRK